MMGSTGTAHFLAGVIPKSWIPVLVAVEVDMGTAPSD